MESAFMAAVFTALTFCLIAPYLTSIFNSRRAIHCLSRACQGKEQSPLQKKVFSAILTSSSSSAHLHRIKCACVCVGEEEAVFGFGS